MLRIRRNRRRVGPDGQLRSPMHRLDENIQRKPATDKVRDPQRAGLILLHLGGSPAQDNHRRCRVDGPNFLEHGQPVHLGHAQIEDGDTRRMLPEQIQSFTPTGTGHHMVSMPRQDGLQEIAIHLVVVNDQYCNHADPAPPNPEYRRSGHLVHIGPNHSTGLP